MKDINNMKTQTKTKTKNINLGYLHIASWNPKEPLFPEWFNEDPKDLKETQDNPPETIVLEEGEYKLKIDYPLNNPSVSKLKVGKRGLSRIKLADKICKQYKKIYQEEDKSIGHKTGNVKGMFNRAESDGKYGIWGHYIDDLTLHCAVVKNNVITVGVDS